MQLITHVTRPTPGVKEIAFSVNVAQENESDHTVLLQLKKLIAKRKQAQASTARNSGR